MQIGITVVGATAAAFGGATLARHLQPLLAHAGISVEHAEDAALALVVAFVSYLSVVLGELVPKSLALRGGENYGLRVAKPLLALSWIMKPVVWLLTTSSNVLLRPFGDRTTFTETRYSPEEIRQVVSGAMQAGTLHPDAGQIAARALAFADLRAGDVMVSRQDVVFVDRRATPEELQRVLLEHPHTRFPVFEERVDNVVGYVSVKDLLNLAWQSKLIVLEDVLRSAHFVPESIRAVDLLRQMREERIPLAILVEEQGGMSGIVTFEDLVEELVGEFFDEHSKEMPFLMAREAPGRFVVRGSAPVRSLNRDLGLHLPESGDFSTVAGLYLSLAGKVPERGDEQQLDDGSVLQVVEATNRRIRAVRVIARAREQEPED